MGKHRKPKRMKALQMEEVTNEDQELSVGIPIVFQQRESTAANEAMVARCLTRVEEILDKEFTDVRLAEPGREAVQVLAGAALAHQMIERAKAARRARDN